MFETVKRDGFLLSIFYYLQYLGHSQMKPLVLLKVKSKLNKEQNSHCTAEKETGSLVYSTIKKNRKASFQLKQFSTLTIEM